MEILIYTTRCIVMFIVVWFGVRLIGKKSIAQITAYELAGIFLLTTVAAEPLVYKVASKSTVGVVVLSLITILIGKLSLNRKFYNTDNKPSVVIINGKIDVEELRKNNINIPFLLSQLRLKNIFKISEVEYAIVEPNGHISVLPKSDSRNVKPKDLNVKTKYEGLALPLIINGEIQYSNLKYANLDVDWLKQEIKKTGNISIENIVLAELNEKGELYTSSIADLKKHNKNVPPVF